MGAPRRRADDGFRLRLSTSNLPGTLFLLILIVCATVLMLSKGLNSLKDAYAESNRTLPNPSVQSQNSSSTGTQDSRIKTEDIANTNSLPSFNKNDRSAERSSDYVLIPSKSKDSTQQKIVN